MGQSHDTTESSFSQSNSPAPNSTGEFSFDGNHSVGMKRKFSPPSSPSPSVVLPQVVPKNISTYYFKHSDTEPELNQNNICNRNQNVKERIRMDSHINQLSAAANNGTKLNEPVRICQKSRMSLDFCQEFDVDLKSLNSYDEMSFGSLDLDLEEDDTMEMEEVGGGGIEDSRPLPKLDEIEELVQNAELLVVQFSRGAECVNLSTDDAVSSVEDEGEEQSFVAHADGEGKSIAAVASYPLRKCSGCSSVTTSVSSIKSKPVRCTNTGMDACSCTAGGGVLDGESVDVSPDIISKSSKKSARVRQWIRAHNNSEIVIDQKNTSSCDASAESTSDSESSEYEHPLSSDDPTTVSTSTFLHQTQAVLAETGAFPYSNAKALSSCSSSNNIGTGSLTTTITKHRSPSASTTSACGPVVWRTKKKTAFVKQRPKSFTEALVSSSCTSQSAGQSTLISSAQNSFVSDTALNLLGNKSTSGSWSSSGGGSTGQSDQNVETVRDRKKSKFKRRFTKCKRKSVEEIDENHSSVVRSTSFCEAPVKAERLCGEQGYTFGFEDRPVESFNLNQSVSSKPGFLFQNSDNGSVNVEDHQDWDSYQEKYNSEPYSEEPYDPDGTLKLLSFGEDYGQYLDRADSECSSILSGFHPNPRKRRPLMLINRNEMPESDSDREELNHLLSQSASQFRFIDVVFKKQIAAVTNMEPDSIAEYAEMEATCEENINSLNLVLSNVEKPDILPFEINITNIKDALEGWYILKERITQASKLQNIQQEIHLLKKNFNTVQSQFGQVDPFDSNDLLSLQEKINHIQNMLGELTERKQKLQSLNEASLGTQLFLKDTNVVTDMKEQLQELYALYEENFQLGSYLLEKMCFLQEAWETFETEKMEFEKSISLSNLRPKVKKELSSAASSDSGHGTDFSHDSSISDSDVDFQERRQKLVALRKRASDLKTFLPPGSPVLDVIDERINEAQLRFETMGKSVDHLETLNLKIIYPKKRSPVLQRKVSSGQKISKLGRPYPQLAKQPSQQSPVKKSTRKWRIVRLTLTFHLALMGLLAAAYFIQPKCCEFSNTFCFSLVPHLTHESLPPI